jgi:hypothetical protein
MHVMRNGFHFHASMQSKLVQGTEGEIASTNPTVYFM